MAAAAPDPSSPPSAAPVAATAAAAPPSSAEGAWVVPVPPLSFPEPAKRLLQIVKPVNVQRVLSGFLSHAVGWEDMPPLLDAIMHDESIDGRRARIVLSHDSHDPWVPPRSWLTQPPYRLYDTLYAFIGAAASVVALAPTWTDALARLRRPLRMPLLSQVAAVAVAGGVYWFFERLERVSYTLMLKAEHRLLCTVEGDVRHHWNRYTTKHATWHIHSLCMRTSATPHESPHWRKPAVVLLHGHSAGAAHWEAVFDRIGELADFYVLDMPGWGRSPIPEQLLSAPTTKAIVDLHTEMLRGWLEINGLSHGVTLVGHSFGGFYAIQFTHRYPQCVQQLIVVAPAGLVPAAPEGSFAVGYVYRFLPPQRIARITGRLGYALFKKLYLELTTEDRRLPDVYYQLAAQTAVTGCGDSVAARFFILRLSGDMWWSLPCLSELMRISCRVSVIWGQRDDMLPPLFGPLLHRIRPHTDLYLIKDTMHNPAHNNARAFCDAIADCLLKHYGGKRSLPALRGSGQLYADGTADALLEPTARASSLRSVRRGASSARSSPGASPADSGGEEVYGPATVRGTPTPTLHLPHRSASTPTLAADAAAGGCAHVQLQAHPESATQACAQSDAAVVPVPPLRFHEELQPSALHAAVRAPPATCVAASTSSSAAPASAFVPIARSRSAPLLHNAAGAFGERGLGGSWGLPMLARGEGRGYCNACFVAVTLHKSYWRCACAAWSFNAHLNTARTRFHYRALLAFLDELYVWGNFNARTSRTIVMYLRVHTPLPTRLSSASSAAPSPASARAPPSARDSGSGSNVRGDASAMHVHALLPTGSPAEAARIAASPQQSARSDVADGGVQAGAGGSSSSARGTVEMGIEEYLQNLYHDTSRGRTGAGSNGIVFPPAPATIPRGDAYLLD